MATAPGGLIQPPKPVQTTGTPPPGGGVGQYTGYYTAGTQPGGNNYPTGIYGVGPNGSGTAVGTLQPNELVSNNLTGLLNSDSPYIKQARLQAANQANSRGALNSSVAAGNAQAAAIQAGLPIAQGDAQAALSLQESNLGNLSKAETANTAANAQVTSAGTYAAAQEEVANANNLSALQRQRENLAFTGEQNQLNYGRSLGLMQQQYYNQYGLNQQNFENSMDMSEFNLGASLLTGQQNFFDTAGIQAMSNPAIMGDPAAFGGYLQFLSGPFSGIIDNLFTSLFGANGFGGGGTPQPANGGQ